MTLSPERKHIAKIFKQHIDQAIAELGSGYEVTLEGKFYSTPIRILIEVTAKHGIP